MTRRPIIEDLTVLNQFHPEPENSIDHTTTIRAQARLEQIIATPRENQSRAAGGPAFASLRSFRRMTNGATTSARVRAIRWAAIPIAAAAAFIAGSLLPHSPMVQPAQATLRGWTATPIQLIGDQFELADASCRPRLNRQIDGMNNSPVAAAHAPADWDPGDPVTHLVSDPVVAEQRGDWARLVYLTETGQAAICMVWLTAPGGPQALNGTVSGSMRFEYDAEAGGYVRAESAPSMAFFGGISTGDDPRESDRQIASAMGFLDTNVMAHQYRLANGEIFSDVLVPIDPDVVKVVVHTVNSGDVEASIGTGFFIAWWPGTWNLSIDDIRASDGEVNLANAMVSGYTVTRADGSTEFFEFDR